MHSGVMDFIPELLLLLLSAIAEQGRGLMQLGADSAALFQDSRSLWWIPRLRLYICSTRECSETRRLIHEFGATPWNLYSGHLLVSQSRPPKTTLGITERLFLDVSIQLSLSLPTPEKQETRVYLYCYFLMSIGILSSIYNQDRELEGRKRSCYFSLELRLAPPRTAG